MLVVLRYVVLLGLSFCLVLVLTGAILATGQSLTTQNYQAIIGNGHLAFVVGAILSLIAWLTIRQAARIYLLDNARAWFKRHKENLLTFALVSGFCIMFLVL